MSLNKVNIIFNDSKHHLGAILRNIWQLARDEEISPESFDKLMATSKGIVDVYTGELSPEQIKDEVGEFLSRENVGDAESYSQYLRSHGEIKRRGYYFCLTLSDKSVFTLREGDGDSFVHIHPARYSPHTFRVRVNSLKTALWAAIIAKRRNSTPFAAEIISEARDKLGLSPLGPNEPSAIYSILEKMGFSQSAAPSD